MAEPAPLDWEVVQKGLRDFVVEASGLERNKVLWGDQDGPRAEGVAITMLLNNNSDEEEASRSTRNNVHEFSPLAISSVDAGANTLTRVAHGRMTGDGPVLIESTVALPGNVPSHGRVWLVRVDDDTLRLAATFWDAMAGEPPGSAPAVIDLADAGSGTITISSTPETQRAGQEILHVVHGTHRVTLELRARSATKADGAIGVGNNMAFAVLSRVKECAKLPAQKAILEAANIAIKHLDRVRAIQGKRDAALYEPRAYLDIHVNVPWERFEYGTTIERARITNLLTGVETTISRP